MSTDPRIRQQDPVSGLDLTGFPRVVLHRGDVVYRSHRAEHDHRWYSSGGAGRFDLEDPRGTTYVAGSIAVAVREALGVVIPGTVVTAGEAKKRNVTKIEWLIDTRCANLGHEDASPFGVSSELSAGFADDYSVPMAWAEAFHAEGLGGIHYVPRFSTGEPSAWAVFGNAGAHDVGKVAEVISGRDAYTDAGVGVVDIPTTGAVRTIDDPPGGGS